MSVSSYVSLFPGKYSVLFSDDFSFDIGYEYMCFPKYKIKVYVNDVFLEPNEDRDFLISYEIKNIDSNITITAEMEEIK